MQSSPVPYNSQDAARPTLESVDPVVGEAIERFHRCTEWESFARERFIDDIKFANADSENGYQWPNSLRQSRDVASKPSLTMNIIRQHNLMIVNEGRRQKSEIKILARGNGATVESAQCLQQLVRRILYQSEAQSAFTTAQKFQVDGGIGWWRIVTDYEDSESFDQEVFIRRVWDPLSVYLDPDIETTTGEDARFGFVFDVMPRKEFDQAYPDYAGRADLAPLGASSTLDDDILVEDHIRVCEYFRRVPRKDELISFIDPRDGVRRTVRRSQLVKEMESEVIDHPLTRIREMTEDVVEWFLIAGEMIIDKTIWPGKYIPLIRVIGEEVIIGGILDRKGHTRNMKDAQRMYNYNASAQVEFVALQGKTPWIAAAKAIEGNEALWASANLQNHAVLVWNHVDDNNPDKDIPPPMRQEPPSAGPAYEAGMQTAFNQMMMTSGQWQNQMGMMGNERTGKAIGERQKQSDTATYHYYDNYAEALRYTGKQLIDLIPKVYDTQRIVHALADDGVDQEVQIDPAARMAYLQQQGQNQEIARRIFNPRLGKYEIAAEVGPAYATERQETVDAMTLILTQAPALTGIIGDLLLKAMSFKEAQEAAQRLKRMVPPQALGLPAQTPQEQQLQMQVQQLSQLLQEALERSGKAEVKLLGKEQMRDIDVYKAETDRLKALLPKGLQPEEGGGEESGIREVLQKLIDESLHTSLLPIIEKNLGQEEEFPTSAVGGFSPPAHLGAQQANDGNWYVMDPTRRGRYLRIEPLATEGSRQ